MPVTSSCWGTGCPQPPPASAARGAQQYPPAHAPCARQQPPGAVSAEGRALPRTPPQQRAALPWPDCWCLHPHYSVKLWPDTTSKHRREMVSGPGRLRACSTIASIILKHKRMHRYRRHALALMSVSKHCYNCGLLQTCSLGPHL